MDSQSRLVLLGASHHTAPVSIRERLAVTPERTAALYQGARAVAGVRELVLLNTCNRLELYAVASDRGAEAALEEFVCRFQDFPAAEFQQHRFIARDGEAIGHLLEVACGADSQIVGETEIFGQVKAAYSAATTHAAVGPILNRVFQKGFQAAKFIRTSTPIGEGQVSVATVAVDLAGKIFGELRDCRVLVIGTGEVGEKTLKALYSRGAKRVTVLSRIAARAEALAATVGAKSGLLDQIATSLPAHDIVVGCTTAATPVVTSPMVQAALKQRQVRPLFLIDLGIPRNFEAATGEVDSVFLYDLDDLARIADENLATRRAAVDRCKQLAREKSTRIWEGVASRFGSEQPRAADSSALSAREQVT